MLLAIPGLDWRLQLVIFAGLAVALIFIGRRRFYGRMSEAEDHTSLNRRGDRFVGQSFPLAGAMTGGRGRVSVSAIPTGSHGWHLTMPQTLPTGL